MKTTHTENYLPLQSIHRKIIRQLQCINDRRNQMTYENISVKFTILSPEEFYIFFLDLLGQINSQEHSLLV